MIGSGSDDRQDARPFAGKSRRAGKKGRRKWVPEPGKPEDNPAPPPPRHQHPPLRRRRPLPETRQDPPQVPPPPRQEPPRTTADQAYTVEMRRQPPPPPRERPEPPRARGPAEPGARGYDRYATDGFQRRHPAGPPPPQQPPAQHGEQADPGWPPGPDAQRQLPKKITVTRVAAMRGRELSGRAVDAFQRAHKADGADKSGLTSLSWALMLNYASDAALAVALANTLFFSAASAESQGKVALYLLVTLAPFAVIAPLIGPALDRVQRGRRLAMAVASGGQALMCIVIAVNFDTWLLYPAALGKMVLSKSFMVLKSAVTPRVVPPEITLSKTNARLTVFGLAAAGAGGGVASLFSWIAGSPGALLFAAAISVAGAAQALWIPSWVESTEGEVPATLHTQEIRRAKQPIGEAVVVALWGNGTIRLLTGFLMLFAAFAVKASTDENGQGAVVQLMLLGIIGGAAGLGGFLGNAIGSRLHLGRPDQVIIAGLGATLVSTLLATLVSGIATAAVVGLIGATASALAKISLDAIIQRDLPEQSRASAFGRSETVLQLAWCFGGAVGLLLPPTYWIGFLVVSVFLALGLAQTVLVRSGRSLLPSGSAIRRAVADRRSATPNRATKRGR